MEVVRGRCGGAVSGPAGHARDLDVPAGDGPVHVFRTLDRAARLVQTTMPLAWVAKREEDRLSMARSIARVKSDGVEIAMRSRAK